MERGWVKLWRKSVDTEILKDPHLWQLWTWCLMKATREPYTMSWKIGRGSVLVPLQPGQFVFGRFKAAKALGCNPSSVSRRLDYLRRRQMVGIQPGTHYSIVTIQNWEHYQSLTKEDGQASGHPSGHPMGTYKKLKNNTNPSGVADATAAKGKPKVKTVYDEHGRPYQVLPSRPSDPEDPRLNNQADQAEERR